MTNRAFRIHAFGGPEVLRTDEIPIPELAVAQRCQQDLFPRSSSAAAEAERTLKLCFSDNAPRNLVELFSNK
jgi:hypothetical protein